MRYTLLLAAIVILATGCKKEEETDFSQNTYCWICNEHMTSYQGTERINASTTQTEYCGKTMDDIKKMKESRDTVSTVTIGNNKMYTLREVTDCQVRQ